MDASPRNRFSRNAPALPVRPGWRAAVAAAMIVGVYVAVIVALSFDVRERLRAQVLDREGELLQSVMIMQSELVEETLLELGLGADIAMDVAARTSRLRGVLAVRIFDEHGRFVDAVPVEVTEGRIDAADLEALAMGGPVERFYPAFELSEVFLQVREAARAPVLEVVVPFVPPGADGGRLAIQYWINGLPVAAEFSLIDQRLFRLAAVAALVGAVVILGLFWWAMRRLAAANALLHRRAEDLARANRELSQVARTSAIGAITAHLMHGLRNPLAGLEGFVETQAAESGAAEDGEWAAARESTRRLRSMVNEVIGVLGDIEAGAEFEMSVAEVCEALSERTRAAAEARGVAVRIAGDTAGAVLDARAAGLGGFVLANLVQNAVEASPEGGEVEVTVDAVGDTVHFRVKDHGPGLPLAVAADPFKPRRSTKPDGAGIGLAISRELARHAGGELELETTGPDGTVFHLRLPATDTRETGGSEA